MGIISSRGGFNLLLISHLHGVVLGPPLAFPPLCAEQYSFSGLAVNHTPLSTFLLS